MNLMEQNPAYIVAISLRHLVATGHPLQFNFATNHFRVSLLLTLSSESRTVLPLCQPRPDNSIKDGRTLSETTTRFPPRPLSDIIQPRSMSVKSIFLNFSCIKNLLFNKILKGKSKLSAGVKSIWLRKVLTTGQVSVAEDVAKRLNLFESIFLSCQY